jgi:hypothetical protein
MLEGRRMIKNGWVCCRICGNKTRTKIRPDTEAVNLPVFCPVCKNQSIVDIVKGNVFYIQSQTHDAEPNE